MDDRQIVRLLKALADERRFQIVREVAAAGELSCGQLGEKFELAQPTISHHLKILVDAGLLQTRRDAQHHFLTVDPALLRELGKLLPSRLAPAAARGARRVSRAKKPAKRIAKR